MTIKDGQVKNTYPISSLIAARNGLILADRFAAMTVNDNICHNENIMAMTSMNVSLPDELKQYVEAQTKAGYSTPSEYVRELIREDQKRRAQQRLEQLLVEGLQSGEAVEADEKFWAALKTEALAQMEARRKSRTRHK